MLHCKDDNDFQTLNEAFKHAQPNYKNHLMSNDYPHQ